MPHNTSSKVSKFRSNVEVEVEVNLNLILIFILVHLISAVFAWLYLLFVLLVRFSVFLSDAVGL